MLAQDCLGMLREIKSAAFATVDEKGLPQVRIIDIMLVEEGKLYFMTARGKDFYRELLNCPHLSIVGLNDKWQSIRLEGPAQKLEDQKHWVDRLFEENPVMKKIYPGESRYILEAFVIDQGELELFDVSGCPIYRESFGLGGAQITPRGFVVGGGCTRCGRCANSCPQNCIETNTHYKIKQENCLRCGLCAKRCPTKSIRIAK